jgi:hypothetical protein
MDALAAMYGELKALALCFVASEDIAHDTAGKIIQKYITEDGYRIRSFPVFVKFAARNAEKNKYRAEQRARGLAERFADVIKEDEEAAPLSREEALAIIEDHAQGAEIMLGLRMAKTTRAALASVAAAGIDRGWIRRNVEALRVVWEGGHATH